MEKSNTKNNNKTYQNDSISALFMFIGKLKKYLVLYLAAAIIGGVLSLCYSLIYTTTNKPELKALVGFSYDGIDKGLDPNGRKFDINTLKSPAVIEMVLTELMSCGRRSKLANASACAVQFKVWVYRYCCFQLHYTFRQSFAFSKIIERAL